MNYFFLRVGFVGQIHVRIKILECFAQSLGGLLLRLDNERLEVDGQAVPKHRLDKYAQRLDVDPGGARLAKVYFQPSH